MFAEFHGLPIHALVVHAAVVATPVAALLGIAYLVPRWRSRLRWPLLALVVIAAATILVARLSGQSLKKSLASQITGNVTGRMVSRHEHLADQLFIALLILLVVVVIAVLVQPRIGAGVVSYALPAVITVVAVGVLVLTVQTGEAGAKAAWNPSGTVDYSAK